MNKLFLSTIFLSIFSTVYAQKDYHTFNSADTIKAGVEAHDSEEYAEAIRLYDKISESDTNYVLAQYEKTMSLNSLERHQEAIDICSKFATEPNPYSASFYNIWGNALDQLKNTEKSIEIFNQGLERFPYNTNLLLNKGVSFISLGMLDSAIACFQRGVEINYFHASLHAKLGSVYLMQGRKIPAIYAYTTYLTIAPAGSHAAGIIQQLLDLSGGKNFVVDSVKNASPDEDKNYQQITKIYESKISADKGYKVKSKLKDNIVKQQHIVLTKTPYVSGNKDFVNHHYVRYFNKLIAQGQFANLSYTWFISLNSPKIESLFMKNKKKITDMLSVFHDMVAETRQLQTASIDGKKSTYYHWYNKSNQLEAIGTAKKSNGEFIPNGKMVLISPYGNLVGFRHLTNGVLDGAWEGRYYTGIIQDKAIYKNGKLNGKYTYYNSDGSKNYEAYFVNDKLEGEIRRYNKMGMLSSIAVKKDGLYNGPLKLFHETGYQYLDRTLKNDKLEGISIGLNKWNDSRDTMYFSEGLAEGKTSSYYYDGTLEYRGQFKNDKNVGKWEYFHKNGQLELVKTFNEEGKLEGTLTSYLQDGTVNTKEVYNNGKLDGKSEYYDIDGKLWYTASYKNDKLKGFTCYSKDGSIIKQQETKDRKLEVEFYYPNGNIKTKGTTVNEEYDGEHTTYFNNGKKSVVKHYKNGELEGDYKEYFPTGDIEKEYMYENGFIEGLYKEYYRNGKLYSEGMYKKGQRTGDWFYYYPNGTLSSKEYFVEGEITGWDYNYEVDGKLSNTTVYKNGYIKEMHFYDTTGKVIYTNTFSFGSGPYKSVYWNGAVKSEGTFVANEYDSTYTFYYPNGTVYEKCTYNLGDRHGKCKQFYENGSKRAELNYEYGERSGNWVRYARNGKHKSKGKYLYGEQTGLWQYSDADGVLYSESEYREGKSHGFDTYVLPDGTLAFKLFYHQNILIGYTYKGKDGKELPMIPIKNETADITCYHPNGSIACKMSFDHGYLEGERLLYFDNGKLYSSKTYKHSKAEGKASYHYKNGQLEEERNYFFGDNNGIKKKFRIDGSLEYTEEYLLDNLHGTKTYYDRNGKIVKTEHYLYDYKF